MPQPSNQILTVAQMRDAEEALIAAGSSVDALMQVAGRGAAEWVWRVAAGRRVTVLCGPGNNGGDGYVIAEALRARGGPVQVIAAMEPKTAAARNARALYGGAVLGPDADPQGDVLVDCLFGSGLTRRLGDDFCALLTRLAGNHAYRIAIDLPSGVESDSGAILDEDPPEDPFFIYQLPQYHLTLALGAWKFAHYLMPASAQMGVVRLVDIGVDAVPGAAEVLARPSFSVPEAYAQKYRRGLLAVIGGAMPGAALLACRAAQGAGAGYVRLLGKSPAIVPPDVVLDSQWLPDAPYDRRISALLVGPGLGRDDNAELELRSVIYNSVCAVLDADALMLLKPPMPQRTWVRLVATPHEGELAALEKSFGLSGAGTKVDRARALAAASDMVIVAKGPDTVIAAPDGRCVLAPRASSWLSTAGTGDVLAGIIASRLALRMDCFTAAAQGVWLHGEAARRAGAAFSAAELAAEVRHAYAACL